MVSVVVSVVVSVILAHSQRPFGILRRAALLWHESMYFSLLNNCQICITLAYVVCVCVCVCVARKVQCNAIFRFN